MSSPAKTRWPIWVFTIWMSANDETLLDEKPVPPPLPAVDPRRNWRYQVSSKFLRTFPRILGSGSRLKLQIPLVAQMPTWRPGARETFFRLIEKTGLPESGSRIQPSVKTENYTQSHHWLGLQAPGTSPAIRAMTGPTPF
jgi:hypothetical protein